MISSADMDRRITYFGEAVDECVRLAPGTDRKYWGPIVAKFFMNDLYPVIRKLQ